MKNMIMDDGEVNLGYYSGPAWPAELIGRNEPLIPMTIREDVESPLEKTRLYFSDCSLEDLVELVEWRKRLGSLCITGWDSEGRPYIEY